MWSRAGVNKKGPSWEPGTGSAASLCMVGWSVGYLCLTLNSFIYLFILFVYLLISWFIPFFVNMSGGRNVCSRKKGVS